MYCTKVTGWELVVLTRDVMKLSCRLRKYMFPLFKPTIAYYMRGSRVIATGMVGSRILYIYNPRLRKPDKV